MKRIGLRFEDWPEADRVAWVGLFQKGHPLDGSGPLCHYRDVSITHLSNAYSYWLAWLHRTNPALLSEPPLNRITAEGLNAWRDAMAALAPQSVCSHLLALGTILRALDQKRPNLREKAVIHHATAHAEHVGSERKQGRIMNIASVAAFQACPNFAVYGATKSYVLMFSEALAEEEKKNGI